MTVVGLHPEELLDKWADGSLSESEESRLEAHVATCAACRFEMDVRADFADVAVVAPMDASLLALAGRAAPQAAEAAVAPPRRRKRAALVLGLAAALLAGASLAAAAIGVLPRLVRDSAPASVTTPAPGLPRGSTAPAPNTPSIALSALPLAPEAGKTEPAHARVVARPSAADLFRDANAARRDGDTARAVALYRTLEAEYPRSEEARLSYATLGRLQLDRGDAKAALAGFDAYLSKGGAALGEEALVGRALSLQKLGSRDGEISAWQEVLRRFPKSIYAKLARSRIAALSEP
ncbi:MAG TPA: zf-HC2 domain-containing protein [Polyangiaceae bacterium]|nr:zf-HC2 domain-containing protein [Polyangiaceae bacterium]